MIQIYTWNVNKFDVITSDDITLSTAIDCHWSSMMCYVDYTRGDETQCRLTFAFKDDRIGDYFDDSYLSSSNVVVKREFIIDETCKRRIPIPLQLNERSLKITVSLDTPSATPGTVKVWIVPPNDSSN